MAMDSGDYRSLVLYFGRERFYHSMQKAALDGLAKHPMQSEFRLFNGIALALGNRQQEGIRELNPLRNDGDMGLAATMILIHAHKHCRVIDRDALYALEQHLSEIQGMGNACSYYFAAIFLYLSSDIQKAHEHADKAIKLDGKYDAALILKIWCELSLQQMVSGNVQHALEASIARSEGKNIDASLALVRFFQTRAQFEAAIAVLNKLSVRLPELNIPLIEKMETQLAALDWDHALETSMRVINLEPSNVSALRVKGVLLIARESNFKAAMATLQQLLSAAERVESGNHLLLLQICQLFARICSRNAEILQLTERYIDKINQLNPGNVIFVTELGYQRLLLDGAHLVSAETAFRTASNIDGNNFEALCGLALCKLQALDPDEKDRHDIAQQLSYLTELSGNKREPLLLYMSALLSEQRSDYAVQLLVEASTIHTRLLEKVPFGVDYISQLNPDFMLLLTNQLLRHSPVQMKLRTGGSHIGFQFQLGEESLHITLKHSLNILEIIAHVCPGHIQALYTRAKVEFLCGESSKAIARLQHILNDIDETYTEAHLLLAQILLQQQQLPKAQQSLELALSHNFAVRDRPMYHLLLGVIQRHQQQLSEAQQSLLLAMQLVGAGGAERTGSEQHATQANNPTSFTNSDKMTLYLELIHTLREIGDTQCVYESERLLQTAMDEFSGTVEEGRLVIAHAELMLQKCNVAKAISLLSAIEPEQSYYIQAKTHLANIYLQHRKDRVAFSKCFKELVDARPEPESYLMLGEAYMSIQEADLAVEAYQKALDTNPQDPLLASKLGRAYVKTHQYAKALKYYHEAVKNPDYSGLKLDLAELYLKLKQFQNAADTLTEGVRQTKINDDNVLELQLRTKQLMLLARIHEKSGNIAQSLQTLQQARDNQYRVQKRCTVDQSESAFEQHKLLSKICLLMAQQSIQMRENEHALKHFKECIKYTPNDIEILAALARLYMQMNSIELCREVCLQILQIDTNNEAASVMMADLSFRKMEFENAAYHFSQLLITQPCYWTALARLIEVMRRSGTLSECLPFLQRAEQAAPNSTYSAGLNYSRGLYEWYTGNPNAALRHFNTARRDQEWGQLAIINMIEICINPDGDIPSGNDLQDASDSGEFSDSRLIALRTAERLLKELRTRPGGIDNEALNHRLLHNFLQMASKQKFQVESVLQDLNELLQKEEYQQMVAPVYAIAAALVQLKQMQRAKNHLKRIVRINWNFEEAEYLERSWLLLADIYIHANKLDVAASFVDRALEHNKSSTKAYELAGYIAEKSQTYMEAAKHYHQAWNCGGRTKPHIGYKLAYNHMKMKKYANAIDVCQQVIKLHPDYTIIRKDILEKCRNNLRP